MASPQTANEMPQGKATSELNNGNGNGVVYGKKLSTSEAQQHNLLLTLSYVLLFVFWGASNFILIPVSVNLIVTSTLIIYIGSHRSLRLLVTEDEGELEYV